MDSDNKEPQWRETTSYSAHAVPVRVTCNLVSMRNDQGRDKLFAQITPQGVGSYCKYCRAPHLVTPDMCISTWGVEKCLEICLSTWGIEKCLAVLGVLDNRRGK